MKSETKCAHFNGWFLSAFRVGAGWGYTADRGTPPIAAGEDADRCHLAKGFGSRAGAMNAAMAYVRKQGVRGNYPEPERAP